MRLRIRHSKFWAPAQLTRAGSSRPTYHPVVVGLYTKYVHNTVGALTKKLGLLQMLAPPPPSRGAAGAPLGGRYQLVAYTLANKSPPWKHTRMNVAPGTLDSYGESIGLHFERFVRNAHCNVSNHMMGKSRFSSQLTDLLNSMLAPDPARRLTTASEVLAHPWFSL
jgi:hypothetical protein